MSIEASMWYPPVVDWVDMHLYVIEVSASALLRPRWPQVMRGRTRLHSGPLPVTCSSVLVSRDPLISLIHSLQKHRINTREIFSVVNTLNRPSISCVWILPLLLSDCLSSWSSFSFLLTRFWTAQRTTFIAFSNCSENSAENGWGRPVCGRESECKSRSI